MIKALAIKELRESAGLAALAGLGMLWTVTGFMEVNPLRAITGDIMGRNTIPFVTNDFLGWTCFFLGGLAVMLGLKQTALENGRGTYYFLFRLPIARRAALMTKMAVGVTLVLIILAVAIVSYGWWASLPGKTAAPFHWSMTLSVWELSLPLPLVYLGAFLSGLRPARWFGTRLAPLASLFVWIVLAYAVPMTWLSMLIYGCGYCCTFAAIFYYAETRDY